jgi:transposase
MARGQSQYTKEFKDTISELYNSGKSLAELSREYGIPKSTIITWLKKSKPVVIDKDTTVTTADYQAMLKKMAMLEEENEILKKAMAIFAKK